MEAARRKTASQENCQSAQLRCSVEGHQELGRDVQYIIRVGIGIFHTNPVQKMYLCMYMFSLTSFQGSVDQICRWSTSLTVTGKDGAVVGGGWCEPSQCEGACCCVRHGNGVPSMCTSLRDAVERIASDHPITFSGGRRRPRECQIPSSRSDCETLWWTSRGWGRTRRKF